MKLIRFLSPSLLALLMSVGVTAGSMYVTVSTASQNARPAAVTEVTEVPKTAEAVAVSPTVLASVEADAAPVATPAGVELTADGTLLGRVSGISVSTGELEAAQDATIMLVASNGNDQQTVTAEDGTFAFTDVQPGVYTIIAAGEQGQMSYGLRLLQGTHGLDVASATPVALSLDLHLDSALAPARDSEALHALLDGVEVTPVEASGDEFDQTAFETSHATTSMTGTHVGHQQLELNADGSLNGQVNLMNPGAGDVADVTDLHVSFLMDNAVAATTTVNADGSFVQHNLSPGVYTMVIAGSDAVAFLGVDVIGNLAVAQANGRYLPTAAQVRQAPTVDVMRGSGSAGNPVLLTQAPGEGTEEEVISEEIIYEEPLPGTGGGGGFAGGGGGVGSGGGGGLGLLGAAGLGLGIAALADDDDGAASPGN